MRGVTAFGTGPWRTRAQAGAKLMHQPYTAPPYTALLHAHAVHSRISSRNKTVNWFSG
ncbi:MAG: hypothetical protein ORN28_06250 [Rhodoferax sp.]|nr:hypothetical protein [Rhodoferax sp.]